LQDFNKPQFSQQIFEKYSNVKFHESPSSESRFVSCGRTERYDEVNSRYRNFVNVVKTERTVNKKMIENITITNSAMRSSSKSECYKCQRKL